MSMSVFLSARILQQPHVYFNKFLLRPEKLLRLCVCFYVLSARLSPKLQIPSSLKFYVHDRMLPVTYGRGSVFLWRRCDMLYTSGFVNDVTFAYNGPGNVDADKESTQNDPPWAAPNRQWRILISHLPCLFLSM